MKQNLFLMISIIATIGIVIFDPTRGFKIIEYFLSSIIETGPILVLMFVFLGFFQVWMQSNKAQEVIENNKGIKGILYAYLLGSMICGPIYPGFSLSKMLLEKGTSISIIIILLSVWATTKIALLPLEIKLLGLNFTIVRWSVTLVAIYLLSIICEAIIKRLTTYRIKKNIKRRMIS